jgi:hypothetical protein
MLTKPLLLLILAACAAPSGAAVNSSPNEKAPPPERPQTRETHWCCESLGPATGTGNGCDEIAVSAVLLCDKVLHCTDGYMNDDGKVTCL